MIADSDGKISWAYQPGARDYFSLRDSLDDALDRYTWWMDNSLCLVGGACVTCVPCKSSL